MNESEWNIILLALGFVLSIAAGLVGAKIQRQLDRHSERQPLKKLLNFGPSELLFVFPHRDMLREGILPTTSTEDFLAINNVISALLNAGWERKIGIRDTTRVTAADKRRNLVIICSPKSNTIADEFQRKLLSAHPGAFFFEEEKAYADDTNHLRIVDRVGARYYSKSYDQMAKYAVDQDFEQRDVPSKAFEDYALLTKVTNPWNDNTKILWVAGIRGIGTWGAAECIKKAWIQIYRTLPNEDKSRDFSALLRVEYDNCDIISFEVCRVELL